MNRAHLRFLLQMTIRSCRERALVRSGPQAGGRESTGQSWAESQGWASPPYSATSHQVSSDFMTEMNRTRSLSACGTQSYGHGSMVSSPEVLLEAKLQGQDSKFPGSSKCHSDESPRPTPCPLHTLQWMLRPGAWGDSDRGLQRNLVCSCSVGRDSPVTPLDPPHQRQPPFSCREVKHLLW